MNCPEQEEMRACRKTLDIGENSFVISRKDRRVGQSPDGTCVGIIILQDIRQKNNSAYSFTK